MPGETAEAKSSGLQFLFLCSGLLLLADGEQFHFEDQGVAGADVCSCPAIAVGEIWGMES